MPSRHLFVTIENCRTLVSEADAYEGLLNGFSSIVPIMMEANTSIVVFCGDYGIDNVKWLSSL